MTEFKITLGFFQSVRRGEKIERSEMSNMKFGPRSEFQMTGGSSGGSSGVWRKSLNFRGLGLGDRVVVVSGNKVRRRFYL